MPNGARFELCSCGSCSGSIVLANGLAGLQVCSKEEARMSAETAWLVGDLEIVELKRILEDIENSLLPETIEDVRADIRMEALADNLQSIGHTEGPPFAWDGDVLRSNLVDMLQADTFSVVDIGVN